MGEVNKYFVWGVKKLFGLASTKIRLARESDTTYVQPKPLLLAELLSEKRIQTVDEAQERFTELKDTIDYGVESMMSSTVLELMDIIEGVKHRFEPPEFFPLVDDTVLGSIEKQVDAGDILNILIMDETSNPGVNLYIGYDPPHDAIHFGRVPTNLSKYLFYAFKSDILSDNMRLKKTNVCIGRKTLINESIYFALIHYGAKTIR
ncbi:MAG: hypothetical protein KKD39_03225 [Candidatus Altiarchaeota archaeon]|nr:hypothetical protein [Candidatus Altiarchaeota archaeon]